MKKRLLIVILLLIVFIISGCDTKLFSPKIHEISSKKVNIEEVSNIDIEHTNVKNTNLNTNFQIDLSVKDSFVKGELVSFDYSIYSSKDLSLKYIPLILCHDAPEATLKQEQIELSAGGTKTNSYSSFYVFDRVNPQMCKAIIEVLEPFNYKVEKSFKIDTEPTFDLSLTICKDEICSEKSNVFVLGEEIYISYSSTRKNPSIYAELVYPDKTEEEIVLPNKLRLVQLGDYEIKLSYSKERYNANTITKSFSVIKKEPEIKFSYLSSGPIKGTRQDNLKNDALYSEKEVFLISDENWQNVLKLYPVTVGGENKFPTLIYHQGNSELSRIERHSFWANTYFDAELPLIRLEDILINGMPYEEWIEDFNYVSTDWFIENQTNQPDDYLDLNEILSFNMWLELNEGHDDIFIETIEITNFNYQNNFELIGGSLLINVNQMTEGRTIWISENDFSTPKFLFHTPISEGFDVDSIIVFLQSYNPTNLTIFGETPQELDDVLIAEPDFGAGIPEENVKRLNLEEYPNYWSSLNKVVLAENNYEIGLLASSYASLINAPLFFQGDSYDYAGLNVILIGNVNCPSGATCNEHFNTVEEIQDEYYTLTDTDKFILANSLDLNQFVTGLIQPQKSPLPLINTFDKTSLSAPYLSALNNDLILIADSNEVEIEEDCGNFQDRMNKIAFFDNFIESNVNDYDNVDYLTILSSPNSIPQSYTEDCDPSSWWHDLKDSTDNLYGSSPNNFFSFYMNFQSISVDQENNIHIFNSIRKDKLFNLLYQKRDFNSGDLINSEILVNDTQYLYEMDSKIDSENKIHLVYRSRKIDEQNFTIAYRKYSTNLELLDEKILVEDAYGIHALNIDIDKYDDVHVTYANMIFEGPFQDTTQVNYIKLSNGEILFNKKIKDFNGQYYGVDGVVFSDGKNVVITKNHTVENWGTFGISYIYVDNGGNLLDEQSFLEDRRFEDDFYSTVDENGSIISFSFSNDDGQNYDPNYYLINNGSIISKDVEITCNIKDVKFDSDNNLHIFNRCWENNYVVMDLNLNMVFENTYPLSPIDQQNFTFAVGEIDGVLVDEKPIILLGTYGYWQNDEYYYWGNYPTEYPENLSYPHFTMFKNDQWTDLNHIDGISVDNSYYLKTGRIYGVSLSDVSSYISNILINKGKIEINDATLIGHWDSSNIVEIRKAVSLTTSDANQLGYPWECLTDIEMEPCLPLIDGGDVSESFFTNKDFLHYSDHGGPTSWYLVLKSKDIPILDNTFVLSQACSNSDFERGLSDGFGSTILRKGGASHFGASGVTWLEYTGEGDGPEGYERVYDYSYFTKNYLINGGTIGGLFINLSHIFNTFPKDYLLYGYPGYEIVLETPCQADISFCGEEFPPDCNSINQQVCCGDDAEENYLFRNCADSSIFADSCYDDEEDNACCDNPQDCVMDGICHTRNRATDYRDDTWEAINNAGTIGYYKCLNVPGMIYDCDQDPDVCQNLDWACNVDETRPYGRAAGWAFEGENQPFGGYGDSWGRGIGVWGAYDQGPSSVINHEFEECCGDDQGEYLISGNGYTRCCDNPNDFIDANGNCKTRGKPKLVSAIDQPHFSPIQENIFSQLIKLIDFFKELF